MLFRGLCLECLLVVVLAFVVELQTHYLVVDFVDFLPFCWCCSCTCLVCYCLFLPADVCLLFVIAWF